MIPFGLKQSQLQKRRAACLKDGEHPEFSLRFPTASLACLPYDDARLHCLKKSLTHLSVRIISSPYFFTH